MSATTYADGFGVWHARVPAQPHRHEMTAYQAIRAELIARAPAGTELPGFGLEVVTDTGDEITYREAWPDDTDACAVCHETVTRAGRGWTHAHGSPGCGTGDGSTAYPRKLYTARGLDR